MIKRGEYISRVSFPISSQRREHTHQSYQDIIIIYLNIVLQLAK